MFFCFRLTFTIYVTWKSCAIVSTFCTVRQNTIFCWKIQFFGIFVIKLWIWILAPKMETVEFWLLWKSLELWIFTPKIQNSIFRIYKFDVKVIIFCAKIEIFCLFLGTRIQKYVCIKIKITEKTKFQSSRIYRQEIEFCSTV